MNRAYWVNALKWYAAKNDFNSYASLLAYYDSIFPGLSESFGSVSKNIDQSFVKKAIEKMALNQGLAYPNQAQWLSILGIAAKESPSLSSAVWTGTREGLENLETGILSGFKIGMIVLIVGGAGFLVWKFGLLKHVKK